MSEYKDACFDTLVKRLRYLQQVAKSQVMRNGFASAANRITEIESQLSEEKRQHLDNVAALEAKVDEYKAVIARLSNSKPINTSYRSISDDWHNRLEYARKAVKQQE